MAIEKPAFGQVRVANEFKKTSTPGSLNTASSDRIRGDGYGKTPMQTFIDTLPVAKEKLKNGAAC